MALLLCCARKQECGRMHAGGPSIAPQSLTMPRTRVQGSPGRNVSKSANIGIIFGSCSLRCTCTPQASYSDRLLQQSVVAPFQRGYAYAMYLIRGGGSDIRGSNSVVTDSTRYNMVTLFYTYRTFKVGSTHIEGVDPPTACQLH